MQPQQDNAKTFVILGWVFTGLGFLFFPIILHPVAMIMGYQASKKGNPKQGKLIMIVAPIVMVASMAFTYFVNKALFGI